MTGISIAFCTHVANKRFPMVRKFTDPVPCLKTERSFLVGSSTDQPDQPGQPPQRPSSAKGVAHAFSSRRAFLLRHHIPSARPCKRTIFSNVSTLSLAFIDNLCA
jgi:hypothetical protein